MSKVLFEGSLSNGVVIEVVESVSLTGKVDFGVRVGGQLASVSTIQENRAGDLIIKTTSKPLNIKAAEKKAEPAPSIS